MITELDHDSFEAAIASSTPTLVDFWADWCMPCKLFAPVFEEMANTMDGKIDFAKVDIDAYPDMAAKYGIESIPTIILFKNGEVVDRMIGLLSKEKLAQTLEKHI